MSLIPKISVSLPSKRSESNLSADCNTSANFGELQPTYCRLMMPDQSNHVKVNSLVRLASMPLPTFADLRLRHYHNFVPMSQIWEQFSSYMAKQPYSNGNTTFVPTQTPRFFVRYYWADIIRRFSYISVVHKDDVTKPLSIMTSVNTEGQLFLSVLRRALADNTLRLSTFGQDHSTVAVDVPVFEHFETDLTSGLKTGGFIFADGYKLVADPMRLHSGAIVAADLQKLNTRIDEDSQAVPEAVGVTGADFVEQLSFFDSSNNLVYDDYLLCYKLMPFAKHLRKIVIGLGSQFNPYHFAVEPEVPFKLIAFYKAWFELFRPKREMNFTQTTCWQLIKLLNESVPVDFNEVSSSYSESVCNVFRVFVSNLMRDTFYYFPQDYFGMSTSSVTPGNSSVKSIVSTPIYGDVSDISFGFASHEVNDRNLNEVSNSAPQSSIAVKLAQRLLTYVNKNTVIGRTVRDYLKVHYGVSDDNAPETTGVIRIGVSDLIVKVAEVTSTAPSAEGFLGEYAGIGIGKDSSETFDFHAKEFGYWLTLSCVFPRSGYYQGTLPENKYKDRFEWFTPEFDALGYQVLSRSELMDNYVANSDNFNPNTDYKPNLGFGFVPRYSEIKVGRNIVNGDLSLNGMPSLRPYYLDRRLPEIAIDIKSGRDDLVFGLVQPSYVPTVVFDNFRKLDPSDVLGQFNRLFNITTNWFDHFIIQSSFVVKAIAPWKSLNDSFDTFNEGESAIDVTHS